MKRWLLQELYEWHIVLGLNEARWHYYWFGGMLCGTLMLASEVVFYLPYYAGLWAFVACTPAGILCARMLERWAARRAKDGS